MQIIYAGGSHYGLGAYRSLQEYFDVIYILSASSEDIKEAKKFQDILIDDFDEVDCSNVFLGGYAQFISEEQLLQKRYINVHGALLPKYRGMHPTFWAIMNAEKELGITFHLVDKYMDHGDIIAQYKFAYTGQPVSEINTQIDYLIEKNAGKVIYDFLNGEIYAVPQNESEALFGARRNLIDCLVDFNWSNELLRRYFQALTEPYPLPLLKINNELYEIISAKIVDRCYFGPLGRAVNIDEDGVWIKTKDGFLVVSKVRKYGEKKIKKLWNMVKIGYRFV